MSLFILLILHLNPVIQREHRDCYSVISSHSSSVDPGTNMESIPDAIVEQIISQINNARDIASCCCISKQWNECIPYIPSLFFPRSLFSSLSPNVADATITRMISQAIRLQELIIYCPYSPSSLASVLFLRSSTLKTLELRMDTASDAEDRGLDSIGVLSNGLEVLKLWGVSLSKSPDWGCFSKLQSLEIVGSAMRDDALNNALKACPNLTDLSLLGCDGVESVAINMEKLVNCRLDFLGAGNCELFINCPSIRVLEVQGFSWIFVDRKHQLKHVSIAKNTGTVYRVDMGRLSELEYLSLRGIQWSWTAIDSVLRSASEVKHLIMKIEFTGDFDNLQPFPEIDLVDFFNGHQKLKKFEIHGAMFAALSPNSLKNLNCMFKIPFLEEVLVTVRSPLNAEQKLNTLKSLVHYSEKLSKLVIRVTTMKSSHEAADDFFQEICRFQYMNCGVVSIE